MDSRGRRRLLKALYDYEQRSDTDIKFSKGDRMDVIDDSDVDWWKVFHRLSGKHGFVPANYVADESSLECEDWFFADTARSEAERLLLAKSNPPGTFLVRSSGRSTHNYSLSVKDTSSQLGDHVKHYKITQDEQGGVYITPDHSCGSLPTLIVSYSSESDLGLCRRLVRPCPKPTPQMYDLAPAVRDNWEIAREEIKLIRKLGSGNFGAVYYGKWKNTTEVAVKTLKSNTMSNQAFLEEAAIMKKIRHRNLVTLYAVCSLMEPVYIVQEYMSKGSLVEFLHEGEGSQYKLEELTFIAAQVASGMKYLESQLLVHRDLAARNVLIGEDNTAKIGDFGLARVLKDDEYRITNNSQFPVKWTPPEALFYGRFSIKSDVWSYGILLMELFTKGRVPYPGMSPREVKVRVKSGYRMPKPEDYDIPDNIYDLMLKCWDEDPNKRPTFEFLSDHFEGYHITSEVMYRQPETRKCCISCCRSR